MEQPGGSEDFEQKALEEMVHGTLRAEFDMCEVGKLRVPKGNNFLRKRTVQWFARLHENCMSLWTRDIASNDTIISRLRAPSDTWDEPSICQNIQLDIQMGFQRMFVGIFSEVGCPRRFLLNFESCV